jgi:AcrR family transcriptional regulator
MLLTMARPREFDRGAALDRALRVFWAKGFAATSTDDLREAMGIGRQSLYGAFGDKRTLYLEALDTYQQRTTSGHLKRLCDPASPLKGIEDLLAGLVADDDSERALGCMGVGSVGEFGVTDEELNDRRVKSSAVLNRRLAERLKEGQRSGEVDPDFDPKEATAFIQMTMMGIQLAARAGATAEDLKAMARFAARRLTP